MSHKIEKARENLLCYGKEALLEGGYDNLNVKDLSQKCGMATGTFYQYFKNKDDLVMQVIYESGKMIPEKIKKISKNDWGLYRKLEYVYRQYRTYQKTYLKMRIGVLRLSDDYEKLRTKVLTELNKAVEEVLDNEVQRGNLVLSASTETAAYLLTHFLFSIGRDATISFDEIWRCMNFKYTQTPIER